jgi:putative NADH-flavin reductase
MRIAMFGATGMVGSAVLSMAIDLGHEVRVLARSGKRVQTVDLDVEEGDALDPDAVARTLRGCDAAASALGGFGDAEAIDHGTTNIMTAMRGAGIKRLVVMQGFHVPFPGDPRNAGARIVSTMLRIRSPRLVASSHALGNMLRDCHDLDWTLIRAPLVTPGPATGRMRQGTLRLGLRSRVTTGDLAEAMLNALADPTTVRTAPMVSSR